jgi:nucleoside-diphosphate-sugar epimerase
MTAQAAGRAATRRRRAPRETLTVAVTGASGTLGPPLLRRLAAERSVRRVEVLGRRRVRTAPGAAVGFRFVDVRDRAAVAGALAGADVVVHTAYALYGVASREADLFATNVDGTLNVARAARLAGAKRFVYTSSAAVYGFHADNPQPLREDAPLRASGRHFYGRHKAQAELLVRDELRGSGTEPFLFRPCAIVGPHAAGGALSVVPDPLPRLARAALATAARAGLRPAAPSPPVPLQFVHEEDVAQALVAAALGRGPGGAYNLAGDGALDGDEVLRVAGLRRLPLPRPALEASARAVTAAPPVLPALGWSEVMTAPLILDTTRVRTELGWSPRYDSREALAATRQALGW